ncbi:DUF2878 domain-containing protein [Kangiella japonica]|uniref:DUF2878 domain-containing protein n=1 Tax=Kangiella japonica TaxID=647384 RepID=A0ABN0SYR5_9GAMM
MAGPRMKFKNLVNFILLQLVWVGFIVGITFDQMWLGPIIFIVLMVWQLRSDVREGSDFVVISCSFISGFVLASIWSSSGLIEFKEHWPSPDIAPWWILALWIALGASFNHSLKWVQASPYLAGAVLAIGGPLSYLAAERIGAIEINTPVLTLSLMAAGWFTIGFLLTIIVKKYRLFEKWWIADA